MTLHMVSSLDGFIAKHDNNVSWMDNPGYVYEVGVSEDGPEELAKSDGLGDEIRLMIAPILLGDGLRLFENSGAEQRWHLKDVVAYKNGFSSCRIAAHQPTPSPPGILFTLINQR